MQAIRKNLSGSYCLASNIDASAIANFLLIGDATNKFTGRLYGDDHTISNVTINSSAADIGLFGFIDGAVIQDLSLVNAKVTATGIAYVGALVGSATGELSAPSTIRYVSVTGQVKSLYYGGGIAGSLDNNVALTQSWGDAKAIAGGSSTVGGLVGLNLGTVQECYATGPVVGAYGPYLGGLIGKKCGHGPTILCYRPSNRRR